MRAGIGKRHYRQLTPIPCIDSGSEPRTSRRLATIGLSRVRVRRGSATRACFIFVIAMAIFRDPSQGFPTGNRPSVVVLWTLWKFSHSGAVLPGRAGGAAPQGQQPTRCCRGARAERASPPRARFPHPPHQRALALQHERAHPLPLLPGTPRTPHGSARNGHGRRPSSVAPVGRARASNVCTADPVP